MYVRNHRSSSSHRVYLTCPSGHRDTWPVVRRRIIRGGGCRVCRKTEAEPGWTWTLATVRGVSSWPAGDLLRAAFGGRP